MNYSIYKFNFTTGVHFGNGMLNDSDYVFRADVLFSAMYIEALKFGKEKELYESVKTGRLLLSDALPFTREHYMLPKPMLHIESTNRGDSGEKKKYKKLNYLPVEWLESFSTGTLNFDQNPMENFGSFEQRATAAVRGKDETEPYHVGVFHFYPNNGLYIIIAYESNIEKDLAEELLKSISYAGIGGEKSSGLGRFKLKKADKNIDVLIKLLKTQSSTKLLLSTALPQEAELEQALDGAFYLLGKRSGFIASDTYASEFHRKKDLYVFMAGSCFKNIFDGDIFDVSEDGHHPVYRYAKPLFIGGIKNE